MNRTGKIIIFVALLIVGSFFSWERFFSPGAKMQHFLDGVGAAAESKNLDTVEASLTEDYSDAWGQDRTVFTGRLAEGFSKIDRLNVTISSVEAEHKEEFFEGRFDLVVVAIQGEQRLPVVGSPLQPQPLRVELVREDGADWRIRKVEKTPRAE